MSYRGTVVHRNGGRFVSYGRKELPPRELGDVEMGSGVLPTPPLPGKEAVEKEVEPEDIMAEIAKLTFRSGGGGQSARKTTRK